MNPIYTTTRKSFLGGAALLAATALMPQTASASLCIGTCGTLGPDGDVTSSPQGGDYDFVTTDGGIVGAPNLGVGGETNGSVFQTDIFSAMAGDLLDFYFNFVTADGSSEFSDYAWARLLNPDLTESALLFTARTVTIGSTVPGFGLPAISATITPASADIIDNATDWSPLGSDSGTCFDLGCGSTGWIRSEFEIASAGNYLLEFGVTNISDDVVNTGLAYDGITVGGEPIEPPSDVPAPATLALFGLGLAGLGWKRRKKA
ncbi:NF038132 family protein [Congregibacter litoralis]|uniref:PEP-CTERM protein sorting domain protein n=1 Tax=Congregibacter litoralis KT71 TaxID=314285 RepID=A4A7Z1_9GAMM|nr:NF038132 family protein [Congregibacter litoralis]EAQ97786.2 PEP-CTERM protein sorting domain protein [Congregibacter litoralis KT71]